MDVSQMTFGIEIETSISTATAASSGLIVGAYHGNGAAVPGLPAGWGAKYDSSIRTGRGRKGVEFVSPVLMGADGLRQVVEVCKVLNERFGARVNSSCGVHVHVGLPYNDKPTLDRLVALTANFETAIYATTGTKNRERGQWCQSIARHGSVADATRGYSSATQQRYHVLNLTNWHRETRPAVEFRAFSGSVNADKLVGYVRLCLGLVERANRAKRIAPWSAKPVSETSPIKRKGGAGQTALCRLFYQLGWIKGRQAHRHGDLSGDGLPDFKRTKKTLMKLARKYDGQD